MTREEQILNKAIDYSDIEENFLEYDDFGVVFDDKNLIEKAFIEGAKWADEHPNLYNNEKYHTVKVSCLDELNRKAALYDEFLDKACKWLKLNTDWDDEWDHLGRNLNYGMIEEFRKAMEE